MNDRSLIEELMAYLYKGFFDKRDLVNEIYQSQILENEIESLKASFMRIISRIVMLNNADLSLLLISILDPHKFHISLQ